MAHTCNSSNRESEAGRLPANLGVSGLCSDVDYIVSLDYIVSFRLQGPYKQDSAKIKTCIYTQTSNRLLSGPKGSLQLGCCLVLQLNAAQRRAVAPRRLPSNGAIGVSCYH